MLDIKFIRENPDCEGNIKKKFQDEKLPSGMRSYSSWTASAGPTFRRQTSLFRPQTA